MIGESDVVFTRRFVFLKFWCVVKLYSKGFHSTLTKALSFPNVPFNSGFCTLDRYELHSWAKKDYAKKLGFTNSKEITVQVWQHRLTPIQKVIADGCHLNRDIQKPVEQHFDRVELKQFIPENFPDLVAHLYLGVATKNAS